MINKQNPLGTNKNFLKSTIPVDVVVSEIIRNNQAWVEVDVFQKLLLPIVTQRDFTR